MMHSQQTKRRLACVLIPVLAAFAPGFSWAQPAASKAPAHKGAAPKATTQTASGQKSAQFVDGIAAVVNKRVITLNQVNTEVQQAAAELKRQNIQLPDHAILQKQVLQRMITEELVRQQADQMGIKVSQEQLEQGVNMVAQRNRISVAQLRSEIGKSGMSWEHYLDNLKNEIRVDQLRQRAVDSQIFISDSDIDAFLKSQARQGVPVTGAPVAQQPAPVAPPEQTGPKILGLAQILVQVPDGASSSKVQELRKKAEAILAKVRAGADFASVAAASSDDPNALKGGELGVRPAQGWPDLFLQATQNLKAGQISGIVQSGNGFHILKVTTRGPADTPKAQPAANAVPDLNSPGVAPQQQGPMMVTQTHARHILIKVSKVVTDEQARTRLEQLRQRIEMGESFADLAKRYSEDVSAPQGGDLGWLTPGETVPAFQQAMDALQPGQISQPVHSPFGWHLIQVEERRTKNMEEEYKRMQARQILFQRRAEPAFEDWLNKLHGEAFIDNRLDPQSNRQRKTR